MCHGMCGSAKCAEDASASIQYMHQYVSYALVREASFLCADCNLFFLLAEVQILVTAQLNLKLQLFTTRQCSVS